MKVLRIATIVVGVFFLLVWGVSTYLGVNDLKACGTAPTSKAGCETAGAIVAVSGGDTSARAEEAITLYKNGWAPLLIFSGAAADKSGPSNAKVMEEKAMREGVNANNIIIDEQSETTSENAQQTSAIFAKYGITSAIIVTSSYHERRTMLEFEKSSPNMSLRSHPVAIDKQWGPYWWLTPTGWSLAIPEVVQSLIVWVGGISL